MENRQMRLKLTLPQAVDLAIKRDMPVKTAIYAITKQAPALGLSPERVRVYVKHRYREEKHSKRNRLTLREVVRNRALRKMNITAKWLYACLADQHDRANSELDATLPTLKLLYGWKTSPVTLKRS